MAGVNDIKEAIKMALSILAAVKRAGSGGWKYENGVLQINDAGLRDVVSKALGAADRIGAEVERTLSHLSFGDTLELVRYVLSVLPHAFDPPK